MTCGPGSVEFEGKNALRERPGKSASRPENDISTINGIGISIERGIQRTNVSGSKEVCSI